MGGDVREMRPTVRRKESRSILGGPAGGLVPRKAGAVVTDQGADHILVHGAKHTQTGKQKIPFHQLAVTLF